MAGLSEIALESFSAPLGSGSIGALTASVLAGMGCFAAGISAALAVYDKSVPFETLLSIN
jgi:hypothetical protein